jgi:hypothetical protein
VDPKLKKRKKRKEKQLYLLQGSSFLIRLEKWQARSKPLLPSRMLSTSKHLDVGK